MKDRYYAGFMSDKPRFLQEFASGVPRVRRRLFAALTDIMAIIYVWTMSSYSINYAFHHTRDFTTVPWWVVLVVAVELAALWESFGVSIGMRLLGIGLASDGSDSLGRHFAYYILWPLSPLLSLQLLFNSKAIPWHERVTGLRVVKLSEAEKGQRPWYTKSWVIGLLVVAAVSYTAACVITQVNLPALFTKASRTQRLWDRLFHPNWSLLGDGVRLLIVTIFMAIMATLFAILVAVPLSFLAARNFARGLVGRTIYFIVRTAADIMRSIDAIIWAIVFIVWVRAGAFPGMLALFVQATANLTKLYSERLESIDPGPVEAIRATGANGLQVIMYGVIPQIINPYLSFTLYQWDINVRMSTVIGIVGGGGIGQMLFQYMRIWDFSSAGLMMLLIMITVWIIDYTSSRLRARLS
jgi:phosphonate transport system permease protein